jgi:flagellin
MRINTNVAALNSYNQLKNTQNNLSKSLSRLSSGKRINGAADDAAGLAISEKMGSQTRGLAMAQRNAQDGISMIQTAEGALKESHSILQRMRELSVQSSNDTNTAADRAEIQKEVNQLVEELDRIANSTEFNTKNLLTGEIGTSVDTAGVVEDINSTSETEPGTYSIDVTALAESADTGDILAADETSTTAAGSFDINVNGNITTIGFEANESYEDLAARINSNVSGVEATFTDNGATNNNNFTIKTDEVGADQSITVTASADAAFSSADVLNGTPATDTGVDATATAQDAAANALTVSTDGNKLMLSGYGSDGLSMEASSVNSANVTVGGSLSFHIGANEDQTMNLSINAMDATNLGVNTVDVTSAEGAENAISKLDDAISSVSSERSKLGAVQNRLDHTINNLSAAEENLTAAESRISDVDMAKEMMNMSKNQILSQAGTAMLAQANQLPQGVLQLLG